MIFDENERKMISKICGNYRLKSKKYSNRFPTHSMLIKYSAKIVVNLNMTLLHGRSQRAGDRLSSRTPKIGEGKKHGKGKRK